MDNETLRALAETLRRSARGQWLDLCDGVIRLANERTLSPPVIQPSVADYMKGESCPVCEARRASAVARVRKHRDKIRAAG